MKRPLFATLMLKMKASGKQLLQSGLLRVAIMLSIGSLDLTDSKTLSVNTAAVLKTIFQGPLAWSRDRPTLAQQQ